MEQNANSTLISLLPLVLLIVVMYFLMIRPQKKKDKEVQAMRNSVQVGDEIVTIGGIVGKVVKTKDETIVIQIGADKVKMEIMRWAVSTCKPSDKHVKDQSSINVEEDAQPKKPIKRLKKEDTVEAETETVAEAQEEPKAEVIDEAKEEEILSEK